MADITSAELQHCRCEHADASIQLKLLLGSFCRSFSQIMSPADKTPADCQVRGVKFV